jgi:hypothetical protein
MKKLHLYIFLKKYKINSRDDPGSSVWASILFWAGCPGLFWNIPMFRVVAFLLFHYRPAGPGCMGSAVKHSAQERRLRQLLF